jgi:hypothetical protein
MTDDLENWNRRYREDSRSSTTLETIRDRGVAEFVGRKP